MSDSTKALLATQALLNTRWALAEELGAFARAEPDAHADAHTPALDPLQTDLNQLSDALANAATAAAVSTDDLESLTDRLIADVLQRARALAETDAIEAFFLRSAALALTALHADASAHSPELAHILEHAIASIEQRLSDRYTFDGTLTPEIDENVRALLHAWRQFAA